jgi:hypothetical protein
MSTQNIFPLSPYDREAFGKLIESANFPSRDDRDLAWSLLAQRTDDHLGSLPESATVGGNAPLSFLDALRVAAYCVEHKQLFMFTTTECVTKDGSEWAWTLFVGLDDLSIILKPVKKEETVPTSV